MVSRDVYREFISTQSSKDLELRIDWLERVISRVVREIDDELMRRYKIASQDDMPEIDIADLIWSSRDS